MLRRTIEYIGICLVLLGGIIVYATLRANGYILATGVLLVVVPAAMYFMVEKLTPGEVTHVRHLRDLKFTGMKIPVDLATCEVKSNNWTMEVARYQSPRIAFLNEISGHSEKTLKRSKQTCQGLHIPVTSMASQTFLSPIIEGRNNA